MLMLFGLQPSFCASAIAPPKCSMISSLRRLGFLLWHIDP